MKAQDIYNYIEKTDTGCWNWTRARTGKGYGVAYVAGRISAHRLSYEVSVGPIPHGKHVLHKCDNPACINPDHLFVGSHRDNMVDKEKKGRGNHVGLKGSQSPHAFLTDRDVVSLLKDYVAGVPRKDLCRRYGIKESSLSSYTDGKAWTHLHGKNGCPTLDELRAAKRLTNVTEQDARTVWKLHFDGLSVSEISSRTGLSRHSVDGLVFGKTWRHLPDAPSLEALKAGGVQRGHNQFSNGGDTRSLHPRTKIPSSEIPTILRRIAAGETLEAIGASYGVKRTAIWRIKRQYS